MLKGESEREIEIGRDEGKVDRSYLLASSIYGLSQSQEPVLRVCEQCREGVRVL